MLDQIKQYALSPDLEGASKLDPLAQMARLGQFANKGNQDLANIIAERSGKMSASPRGGNGPEIPLPFTNGGKLPISAIPDVFGAAALGTASEATMPQNRLGAFATVLPAITKGVKYAANTASEVPGVFKSLFAKAEPVAQPFEFETQAAKKLGSPEDVNRIAQLVSQAKNQGVKPATILTDSEMELYNKYKAPIDESVKFKSQSPFNPAQLIKESESAEAAAAPEVKAASKAAEATPAVNKPTKPGFMAQLVQGKAKVSPGTAQYAIDHPEVLDKAKSIEEATKDYVDATPGLKGKVQSLAQRLNKTVIRPPDYDAAIDRAGRLLSGTELDKGGNALPLRPQDALEGVQSINQALRDKMFTSQMHPDQLSEIFKVKDGLMDFLQDNGAPKIREAAKALFEAHVKDAFSDWLPRNKYGSTDALRTTMGMSKLGVAGALAASGHPLAALPIAAETAMTSPKVMGQLIREGGALRNPATYAPIKNAVTATANLVGGEPSSAPDQAAQWLKMGNTINPGKSGDYKNQLNSMKLPSAYVSGGGKISLQQFADKFADGDEEKALQILSRFK